jgi:hypothetical protein
MAIKYQIIGSEALQRQIELLQFYPEIFDAAFYPAMQEVAELVKNNIRSYLPHHTGKLERALGSRVIHSGTSALGTRAEIGFGKRYKMPSATYAAALNEGAVPHAIAGKSSSPKNTKKDSNLHFSRGERFTSIGSIQHPGFGSRRFMESGLGASAPGMDALFNAAAEKVVQELAKP